MEIDITLCMDDNLKLKNEFNSRQKKMEKSVLRKKSSGSPDKMEYFIVDSGVENDWIGEAVVNPLHDDAQEFSGCFSGRMEAIEPPPRPTHKNLA